MNNLNILKSGFILYIRSTAVTALIVRLSLCSQYTYAQDDLSEFLLANTDDATLLATDYIAPLAKGLGFAANSAWYNTAKPHSMGFDLTATVTAAYIPTKDYFYRFIESNYQDLELLSPSDNMVPAVFGPGIITPEYRIPSTGETFEGPKGNSLDKEFGFHALLFPMIQLGVGVIPNTEVKVRFMPLLEFDEDFEAKMWGVGILHNLNNYFPSGDELLVDISVFGGYTNVQTEILLHNAFNGKDQIGAQALKSWTLEGLVSYDLSVFTFYGGMGYNQMVSDLDLLGTYEVRPNEVLTDPISASNTYKNFKATVGMRVKLAIFTLHGEYSFNHYNLFTAGFGINMN
jgi:hypothetical protein